MKTGVTIFLLLICKLTMSQEFAGLTDPKQLSARLVANHTSEKEKVRAIFEWITKHIAYRGIEPNVNRKRKKPVQIIEVDDDGLALPALTERVATQVLRERQAVCEGYSRLFKSLCDHAGIQSAIITGYARVDMNRTENKFRSNHAWNAVYIDSSWHLLDATWASGYILMPAGEFVRRYDDYYFLTSPEKFVRHHYPDDLRWTLLSDPPVLAEFNTTPFRQRSFNKYFINQYFPSKGIIEAEVGDTIQLAINLNAGRMEAGIAPDSLWDSAWMVHAPQFAYVQPDKKISNSQVNYRFKVESANTQWLYLMFNNDAILRYRLNVRKSN